MPRRRTQLVYFLMLPAIAIAAGILGYYTWQTAAIEARLGEEVIVEATLSLVREKVELVEQLIIRADHEVFDMVDLDAPDEIERTFGRQAARIAPSVRALMVFDESGNLVSAAVRDTEEQKQEFLKIVDAMLPDMALERQRVGRLKHFHRTYGGRSYLFSYVAKLHRGRRFYIVAHHDTGYLVREVLPTLFASEEGKQLYNIVDENNRRVFGPNLARAGDYLVGRRFPTTLYAWRLQVAPKQAPELEESTRGRRMTQVALLGTSFAIILLGVAFVLYGAHKERRLNALKSDFVANVSHELKTPLSVVLVFAEMLLSKRVKNEAKQQQYLELICREAERLRALIDNVLDFAALERGKAKYDLRLADPTEVVTRAVDTFRHRMEQDGAVVHVRHVGEIPPVEIDEQAFLLAVINLLDNAVKYGEGTPIEVTVEATDKEVELRVRDEGPGIPVEDLRRVFERFYRSRRRQDTRGSGIGLSLVQHIAEGHGGRAWARNHEARGAIVSIAIPRPKTAKSPATADRPARPRPA